MDPLFQSYSAKDAKDLVNFIIMTLHSELNKSIVDTNFNNLNNNEIVDQRNMVETFKSFHSNYVKTFCSHISNLFYAIQQTQNKCLKCNTMQYNFQTYFFIIFPLEKVKEYILNNLQSEFQQQLFYNMGNFYNNNNNMFNFNMYNNMNQINQKLQNVNNDIVNIFDCFNYIQKVDTFTGSNAMYCNFCGQMSDANYCNTLLTLPNILIILINRGKGIEFKIKLEFYETLNLDSYAGLNNTSNNYKLIGVITHLGNSGEDGHFIAHCLNPIDKEWYTYNDAIVTKIEDFKRIIDLGMPYLLFYKRINK